MFNYLLKKITKPTTIQYISRFKQNLQGINEGENLVDTIKYEIDFTKEESVLEKPKEDLSNVAPYLRPAFNLAAYVNKSETLQQFVKLGVSLYDIEKNHSDLVPHILRLNFDNDVKPYIWFLSDSGVKDIGTFITKNPSILKQDIDNLQIRINYLMFKKFDKEMIERIIEKNPSWLNYSVQEIDLKLGFLQNTFSLSGNQVRSLVVKKPKLITYNQRHIEINKFVIKEEMGFNDDNIKQILLKKPELFINNQNKILETFVFVHREMGISLETIAKFPQVLTCRVFRIKQRHLFLKMLNKVQYDPKKPNYISLIDLISKDDGYFAVEIAKSSIQAFNTFLKSL